MSGRTSVSWLARVGRLRVGVPRYRCPVCKTEGRPLLDLLGVEPGRSSGSLARDLAVLAVAVPYTLAARLADFLLGVKISPMGIWKVTQRRGQAVANYVILLEDGKPRPFTVFDTPTSQGRMPVELALLFDTTPKVEPLWYPDDIFRFITQWDDDQSRETLHPTKDQAEVRISVYQTFGQKLYRMAQPTTDPHAVTTALGQTRGTFAV